MSSYNTFECATSDDPLLPSVDCSIILTMSGSKRLFRHGVADLLRLSKRTLVQVNMGYKSGLKPDWVTDSAYDLTHAYVHACFYCEKHCILGNVLLIEDDATVFARTTRDDFSNVDLFLETQLFDCYSLASMGWTVHKDVKHRWMFPCKMGMAYTHAVVWSRALRMKLLSEDHTDIHHIDGDFLSRCNQMLVYHTPLVVQTFPDTENQCSWTLMSGRRGASPPSDTKVAMSRAWMRGWIRCMKYFDLDEDPRHWSTIFWVQYMVPILIVLISTACVMWSIRKTSHAMRSRQATDVAVLLDTGSSAS